LDIAFRSQLVVPAYALAYFDSLDNCKTCPRVSKGKMDIGLWYIKGVVHLQAFCDSDWLRIQMIGGPLLVMESFWFLFSFLGLLKSNQ
jgi:hypothetical protein